MDHLLDNLSRQREHIEWINVCERRKNEYSQQIEGHQRKLKEVHQVLMTRVFNDIRRLSNESVRKD